MFAFVPWPLVVGFVFLLATALCQWRMARVPNALSLVFMIGAFVVAVLVSTGLISLEGGLIPWVAGLFTGLLALVPAYARGMWGAGSVKAQAIFGAWVGCALPIVSCIAMVLAASALAVGITLAMCWEHCRSVKVEDHRAYFFPAQITLALGNIAGALLFLVIF